MAMNFLKSDSTPAAKEEHWIPLSDLMTGLMMMFMLVAIVFMIKVESEADNIKRLKLLAEQQAQRMRDVVVIYDEMRGQLYQALLSEFAKDLPKWNAEIDPDLIVRFKEPDVLFKTGDATLQPLFMTILDDFFPRYLRILGQEKFKDSIDEIRIEGHTSSVWNVRTTEDQAYFNNMELSQKRTRSTLEYVYMQSPVFGYRNWLKGRLTAIGLSSSKLRVNPDKSENPIASQRVEFRVRTNADARIGEILAAGQK